MEYTSELTHKEQIAEGTFAFHFKRPEGFLWKAGQSIDLTLIEPSETDEEGNTRAFSIAESPNGPEIVIATRMRDTAFKRELAKAELGFKVKISGPFGSFTLHQNASRPSVFLVGGIGITPFISMLKYAAENKTGHAIYLFYSNRRPEDAAFLNDLNKLQEENVNLHFIPTMTEMEKSKEIWKGEEGYITKEMIEKYFPDQEQAIYYSAGPAPMVASMRKILEDMGVSEDDIKTEEFTGYKSA